MAGSRPPSLAQQKTVHHRAPPPSSIQTQHPTLHSHMAGPITSIHQQAYHHMRPSAISHTGKMIKSNHSASPKPTHQIEVMA